VGNEASESLTRTVDRVAPSITLTSPADGSTIGDTTPTFSGLAGTATGDEATVTVRVYAGSTVGATPLQTLTATAAGGGAYAVDATALPLGTYTARASQSDAAGNTGTSPTTTFTITDLTPPASPTNLTVTARSTGLAVNWADNTEPDLAGYIVYRSDSAGGPA
jgi:predicted phage tail protein